MLCSNCGRELSENEKFCPECGTPVPAPPQEKTPIPMEQPPVSYSSAEGSQMGFSSAEDSQRRHTPTVAEKEEKTSLVVNGPKAIELVEDPEPPVVFQQPSTEQGPEKPKKSKKGLLLAIPAAALVLVGALFFGSKLGNSEEPVDPVEPDNSMEQEVDEPESEPEPEAMEQLLVYIDQAEQLCDQADTDYDAIKLNSETATDEEYADAFRQKAQVMLTFVEDLKGIQQQADAITGLDKKMKTAKDEYFSMLQTSRTAYGQTIGFIADYLDFYSNFVGLRPEQQEYSSLAEYSKALNEWTQATTEQYQTLSCPSATESVWKQYGNMLEYNSSIASKMALSVNADDYLRQVSSDNMTDRYVIMEETLYDKMLDCLKDETNHASKQRNVASSLAEEMHSYAEMTPEEQEEHEFENIKTGRIWVDYDTVDTIYPSLYNTYDAFVIIKTGCISGTKTIFVEAEIPGFTQQYKERIQLDPSFQAIYIKPPALTGDLNLKSAKDAQISVTLYREDGSQMDAKTFPVTIKSKYDFEWYSDEYGTSTMDNILCFLTPEATAITQLKRKAIDEISAMTNGNMESFVGYQPANSNWSQYTTTYIQTAGLMRAMYEMGIRYNNDVFSISGSNQHILLPEDVIEQSSGLCIETSLVMASALQSAGMHAFLVFPPGHAQVAVEVWNSGNHAGEYFLIETTSLSSASNNREAFVANANKLQKGTGSTGVITYYSAESWKKYLENVEYIIDCNDSRLLGLTPFSN